MKTTLSFTTNFAFRNARKNLDRLAEIDGVLRSLQDFGEPNWNYFDIEKKLAERLDVMPTIEPPNYRPLPVTVEFDSFRENDVLDLEIYMLAEPINDALTAVLNHLTRPIGDDIEFLAGNNSIPEAEAATSVYNDLIDSYSLESDYHKSSVSGPTVQDFMWLYRLIVSRIIKVHGIQELFEV